MKCPQCGAGNSAKASYCSSCGGLLQRGVVCSSCGRTLPEQSNYCIYCGAERRGSRRLGGQESPSPRPKLPRGYARRQRILPEPRKNWRGPVAIGVVSAAAVLAVAFLVISYSRSSSQRSLQAGGASSANLNTSAGAKIAWSAEVQRIASKFNCPCEKCGVVRLDECTCDIPRGAVEVKSYIQSLLNGKLSEQEIIRRVEERYGHRII